MAGVNWLKKGRHWSRKGALSSTPAQVNASLIRELWRTSDHAISRTSTIEERNLRAHQLQSMRLQLLRAVAIARHAQQEASRRQVTLSDSKRQLKAMVKLDDENLAKAIEDCDAKTRAAISEAQNAIWLTPEAKWVNDPESTSTWQILAPETVRRSVEVALLNAHASTAKSGRKKKPYQLYLAHACLEYWSACRPKGASGRVEFTRAVFAAADWRNDKARRFRIPEDSKNIERLLSKVASEGSARKWKGDALTVLME
ncbi:hypothetical protein [Pseudomonas kuykendallii]|uniref:hypothetical protein n=1 Tax=Pseudomonas kuykendallii TaxID=1007099 RepID=UPI002354909C|nr:hypothetical protein [Pseudomonas kuykendallii]